MKKSFAALLALSCAASIMAAGCGQKAPDAAPLSTEDPVETTTASDDTFSQLASDAFIDEIKDRGYLIVGCKTDVPNLGYYDDETETWSGLEVELAYQTAADIFSVDVAAVKEDELIQFVPVTVADREEKLENGEIDCMLATYTITQERAETFAFSDSYYTDYIGLMVKATPEDINTLGTNTIQSIADLDGKYIGVPKKATTRTAFLNYIDTMNTVKPTPIFCEYDGYETLFQALQDGKIDVMAVDVSILNGYCDSSTTILGDRFGGQHYGAAVTKDHTSLLSYLNHAIEIKTGE